MHLYLFLCIIMHYNMPIKTLIPVKGASVMSHSKPSATVNQKNSVLIICLHPGIRREFQDYLSALLGDYFRKIQLVLRK